MCCVFFMASVFIVANTIRLLFYSRREEFEIMRLVGATDSFIKTPFYIEGAIQGFVGGILGILILFISFGILILFIYFILLMSSIEKEMVSGFIEVRFLPFSLSAAIILLSVSSGLVGCYLSFKQFLDS